MLELFPHIEPYEFGLLDVDNIHKIYWEKLGNKKGIPVLVLHGGPGAGGNVSLRRFFDPEYYNIIIFDQRGTGRSLPAACIDNNTTQDLIKDIEKLINRKIEIINDHHFPQTDNPMTAKEKKVFEKEKTQRKQEYFAAKNRNRPNSSKFKRKNN